MDFLSSVSAELSNHTEEVFPSRIADQNSSWGISYWLHLVLIAEKEAILRIFVESKPVKLVLCGLELFNLLLEIKFKSSFLKFRMIRIEQVPGTRVWCLDSSS